MKRLTSTASEQHRAEEDLEPVGVEPGEDDALVDHAEDQRAEEGADDRAIAAGQQRTADDGRDDRSRTRGPCPRSTSAPVKVIAWIIATSQADAAVPMKSRILTRRTGTPTLRAAWKLPPTPKIQLPNDERSSSQVAMIVRPIHQKMLTEKLPPPIEILLAKICWASVVASRPALQLADLRAAGDLAGEADRQRRAG